MSPTEGRLVGAEYCPDEAAALLQSPVDFPIIRIWSNGARQRCGRSFAPASVAPKLGLRLEPIVHESNAEPYVGKLLEAAEDGSAPDLAVVNEVAIPDLAASGAIIPLDACRARHPIFAHIDPHFWNAFSHQDEIWGVPTEVEHQVVYYNKRMLRELGWSEQQIDDLPVRVANGEFTLADMRSVAKQAVDAGIAAPGFGFAPRLSSNQAAYTAYLAYGGRFTTDERLYIDADALEKSYDFYLGLVTDEIMSPNLVGESLNSWGNRVVWRDAQAHGRFLFWDAYSFDWVQWQMDYSDLGAEEELENAIGRMGFPASQPDDASRSLVIDNIGYVILSPRASGRTLQDEACKLLAAVLEDDAYAAHLARSGLMGTLGNLPLTATGHLQSVPYNLTGYASYRSIFREFYAAAVSGETSTAAAVDQAIARLQQELGNGIVVDP